MSVPKITYFAGRGRAEIVRLIFAVNNVKFEEFHLTERSQFLQLCDDGSLFFKQVPLLEIDGLKMVQSSSIVRYLGRKYKMEGNNNVEEYRIDMMFEGGRDFMQAYQSYNKPPEEAKKSKEESLVRYMPIFDKQLKKNGGKYLVSNHVTIADMSFFEVLALIEENNPEELLKYPTLQQYHESLKAIPSLTNYFANRLPAGTPEFDEFDFTERSQFEDLLSSGSLLFRQVPLLEMDGLKMVQSAAICRYLARKFQMNGADTVEEFRIDMLFEGTRDFLNFFMGFGFLGSDEEIIKKAKEQGLPRYMPIFEKILLENGTENLVGNRLTLADIGYFEVLLHVEERLPEELNKYSATQEFFKKIKQIPSMDQYLTNVRPPKPDDEYVKIVKTVLLF